MDGAGHFITDPAHEARIEGTITSPLVGGTRPVQRGTFKPLVRQADPREKQMRDRAVCADGAGRTVTFTGFKTVDCDDGPDR